MEYRILHSEELRPELFCEFTRRQIVTDCIRKENNEWVVKNDPFIDDWTDQDYCKLIACLKNTLATGGFVYAAFQCGTLKGFVSVESDLFGGAQRYLDLTSIHVSEELRGKGIGTALFLAAKEWAVRQGAKKLYISAHSAVESQAFYHKMGCVEAEIYCQHHVEEEPYDCQLECEL